MPQLIVVVGGCVVVAVVDFRNHFGPSAPAHLTPRELGRQIGTFKSVRARVRLASLRLRAQARHAIAARGLRLPRWAIGISRLFSDKEKPEVNTAAAAFSDVLLCEDSCRC